MRIHELIVRNVRIVPFARLKELPESGVIVISGENETGKSTLLESIWTVLFQQHSGNNASTKPLRTIGVDESPEIELEATVGPYRFRIFKRYFQGKKAVLTITKPTTKNFSGKDAEVQLEKILQDNVDQNLLKTLFVKQGELDAAFDAAGIPSLTTALENSGEEDTAASDDSALIEAVNKEYERYYTAKGKEKGELKQAMEELEFAQQAEAEARSAQLALESEVQSVEREKRRKAEAESSLPEAETEIVERQQQWESAEKLSAQLQAAESKVAHLRIVAEIQRQAFDRRTELDSEIESLAEKAKVLRQEHEGLLEKAQLIERDLSAANEEIVAAERAVTSKKSTISELRTHLETARNLAQRDEIQEFLSELEKRDGTIDALAKKVPASIDPSAVERAEAAAGKLAIAEATLKATAVKLRLAASDPTTVFVDGEDIELGENEQIFHVGRSLKLDVGRVSATIEPDAGSEKAAIEVQESKAKLSEILEEFQVNDLQELRSRAESYREAKAELDTAQRERAAFARSRDIAEAKTQLERLEAMLIDAPQLALGENEAREKLETSEAELDQAEETVTLVREKIASLQAASRTAELGILKARLSDAEDKLAQLRAERKTAEAEAPIAALREQSEALERQVADAESEMLEARETAGKVDLALAKELLDGAIARREGLKDSIVKSRLLIAEKKGRIEQSEGAAETLIRAEARRESAEASFAQVKRRAAAAALLLMTLMAHRDAARRRYAAPFVDKLRALSHTVFGSDLDFELDEKLQITQRTIGTRGIDVNSLSGGAKEQLGMLARFAVAELVGESDGVPIFIDDALGNTDAERLVMMNRVISNLGRSHQLFVLTSMPSRFDRVVGKVEYTMEELKSG